MNIRISLTAQIPDPVHGYGEYPIGSFVVLLLFPWAGFGGSASAPRSIPRFGVV